MTEFELLSNCVGLVGMPIVLFLCAWLLHEAHIRRRER